MTTPRLSISLLCHNRLELTQTCVSSLIANTPLPFNLTITDNASTDGTQAYLSQLKDRFSFIRVVRNQENVGYQPPHNAAFEQAVSEGAEFFVILNNDIYLGKNWWNRVYEAFQSNPRVALVGSSNGTCSRLHANFHGRHAAPNEPPEYVEGSLLAIRVSLITQLGLPLFSKHLRFIYGEDSDLSLRARERGFQILVTDLDSHHFGSQTIRYLDESTKAKIASAQAANHEYLRSRWSVYLRRRDFRYRVLITRKHALGDVIDVTAVLPAIKDRWPECLITIRSMFPDVFKGNPHVHAALPYMLTTVASDSDYHFSLDLSYERRPNEHTITSYAAACGLEMDPANALPQLFCSRSDEAVAAAMIPRTCRSKIAVLHPGPTGWRGKDWPMDRWSTLANLLSKKGWMTAVVGMGQPIPGAHYDLRHQTSIQVLYALLRRADLFVGLDSGPSHVAQAALVPSVVLFGTIWAHLKLFPASRAIAVQANEKEAPCVGEHHRLPPPIESSQCDGACMRVISVGMVESAIKKALA